MALCWAVLLLYLKYNYYSYLESCILLLSIIVHLTITLSHCTVKYESPSFNNDERPFHGREDPTAIGIFTIISLPVYGFRCHSD